MPKPIVEMLGDRTSRRLFRGESTRRRCCRLTGLQLMLFARKLVTLPEVTINGVELSSNLLSAVATCETSWWDILSRDVGRRRARLRYLVVDVAARLCGLLDVDALSSELLNERPAWAERARRGELVRALLDQVPGLNSDHAKALGRTPSMVSAWRTGKSQPSVHSIHDLATYIGEHDPRGPAHVWRTLHWHYALAACARVIADVEGEAFVIELANVFTQSLACKARRRARPSSHISPEVQLCLLAKPLWRMPDDVQSAILTSARNHGASDEWITDVRSVCAEYAALKDPDEIARRNCAKHRHPLWRVPRPKRRPKFQRAKTKKPAS